MLVKDEVDVVGYTVEYLRRQVDEVVAVDNGSTDGTRELLAALDVPCSVETGYRYSEIVSRLAREAGTRGHGWVVPCDADEVWASPDGTRLGDWLDGLPAEVGVASGVHLNHLETALDDPGEENPTRRLGWRELAPGWAKVAVRAAPTVVVSWGAHDAEGTGVDGRAGGVAVHHFPWRGTAQAVAKIRRGIAAHEGLPENDNDQHWTRWLGYGDEDIVAWYLNDRYSARPANNPALLFDPVPAS